LSRWRSQARRRSRRRCADRRNAGYATRRRDRWRARARDQAAHAACDTRRCRSSIPRLQSGAWRKPGQASCEDNARSSLMRTYPMVALKLEVVVVPVSDVDRAKRFYGELGWRLDADFVNGDWRVVQFTPPGSPCSIHFGKGVTTAAPGSVKNLYLVVSEIESARRELKERGAQVSAPFHFTAIGGPRAEGPDPEGHSYGTYATFSDPDGNSFLLQEVKDRLPGRGVSNLDVAGL